ncbi:unnamed protein product, partial [marine sediment metagenome]
GKKASILISAARLKISEHFFWNSPLMFPDLTQELYGNFSGSDLVLLKGDANYRRLLSDRRWDHTISMNDITGYFPAPFAVLRTLKSELAVDLTLEQVRRLEEEDPEWLVNGKRGMIRFVDKSF